MFRAIVKVQRWWGQVPTPSVGDRVPYEIVCVCGQRHQGWRQSAHQIVVCTTCDRRRFVLPLSPLPRVAPPETRFAIPVLVRPAKRRVNPWIGPLIGAGATLLCVIGIFAAILVVVRSPRSSDRASGLVSVEQVEGRIAAGQKSLSEGDFAEAAQTFDQALDLAKRNPVLLPAGRLRELAQLQRQAALAADWSGEPIELDLSRAAALGEEDWRRLAQSRRGRTISFDGTLRRDAPGRLHADRKPPVEGQDFRIQLPDLKLLKHLPLGEPTRVILLARLAKARREAPGVCVLELDPDSGALLTDKRVAKRFGYAILDPEVEQVLERQKRWASEWLDKP